MENTGIVYRKYTDMGKLLRYLVSVYGVELYKNPQKLNNLVADLYKGDEWMERVFRRAILDDSLSCKIYDLSLKNGDERKVFYNQIISQYSKNNFYSEEFGKYIIDTFIKGLGFVVLNEYVKTVPKKQSAGTINIKNVIAIVALLFIGGFVVFLLSNRSVTNNKNVSNILIQGNDTLKEVESITPNKEYVDEYGVVYTSDRKCLIRANLDLKTYKIKDGTVQICDSAFVDCKELIGIYIPNTMIEIGRYAFAGCENLTSLNIPNSVIRIGAVSFAFCGKLDLILESDMNFRYVNGILYTSDMKTLKWASRGLRDFPDALTKIEEGAFLGCTRIGSINIPNSVKEIGARAFGYSSLYSINIPNSIVEIKDETFERCYGLEKVNLPNTIEKIGMGAFSGCQKLIDIKIPDSVKYIDSYAFSWCQNIEDIVLPNSLICIGLRAFEWCSKLGNIYIPSSVKYIGGGAFSKCKNIKLSLLDDNVYFKMYNEILYSFDMKILKWCPSEKKGQVYIPNMVTTIEEGAFDFCYDLTHIYIPNSVVKIEGGAFPHFFDGDKVLTLLLESNTNFVYDRGCLYSSDMRSLIWDPYTLMNINIPNTVEVIEKSAFGYCHLKNLIIPKSVKKIKEEAFLRCDVENINICNPEIDIAKNAFSPLSPLKSINIPVGTRSRFERMLGSQYRRFLRETSEFRLNEERDSWK